jgi:hypothetical protein
VGVRAGQLKRFAGFSVNVAKVEVVKQAIAEAAGSV